MPKIRVENAYHEFYKILASDDSDSGTRKTFDTMKDVFMLALAFGVAKGVRTTLGPSRDVFEDGVLRAADWDMIKAIALTERDAQLQAIGEEDGLLVIAQEYANSGIRHMQQQFLPAQPEQSLAAALLAELPRSF